MKQLLVDYIPFIPDRQMIQEAISQGRPIQVKGVLQRADEVNQNHRKYPKKILAREVNMYMNREIKENRALGELDHPDSTVVNLSNSSHIIKEIHWEGNNVIGTIEILNTPSGNILKELLNAGIRLGISSRGLGSVKNIDENTVEVDEDFNLICFDFVSNPSTQGAFMNRLNESVSINKTDIVKPKYYNINKIITDILTKKDESI